MGSRNSSPGLQLEVHDADTFHPRAKLGFKSDDEPMDWPEGIALSDEQAQQLEQTGSVALPIQTAEPNAKELEHRRLLAEGGSRRPRRTGVANHAMTPSHAREGLDDRRSGELPPIERTLGRHTSAATHMPRS